MYLTLILGVLLSVEPMVTSDISCPGSEEITSELRELLPSANVYPGMVRVLARQSNLIIQLHPAQHHDVADRILPLFGSCAEMARAVAVIVASVWPLSPVVAKQPIPTAKPLIRSQSQASDRRRFLLGVNGFASVIKDGVAPGLRIRMEWAPWGGAFLLAGNLVATNHHTAKLGVGNVRFQRYASEAGMVWAHGVLLLDAGFILSRLLVAGQGYTTNQKTTGMAVGMMVGARICWTWGKILPFIEARTIGWPQRQQIYVLETTTSTRTIHPLPQGELQLGLGITMPIF